MMQAPSLRDQIEATQRMRAVLAVSGYVYSQLTDAGATAPRTAHTAVALHRAVRRLRSEHPSPERWAVYVHVGA
jgi:hypothetical protein